MEPPQDERTDHDQSTETETPSEEEESSSEEEEEIIAEVIPREQWGAIPATEELPPMVHPCDTVNLTVENVWGPCTTREECTSKVQSIQRFFMEERGYPDIPFNFIVGNDGFVYEGRGWNIRPEANINPDEPLSDKTVDIGLIGGSNETITHAEGMPQRVKLARALVKEYVKKKIVTEDFEVDGYIRDSYY